MHLLIKFFHGDAEKQQYKSNSLYGSSSLLWEMNNYFFLLLSTSNCWQFILHVRKSSLLSFHSLGCLKYFHRHPPKCFRVLTIFFPLEHLYTMYFQTSSKNSHRLMKTQLSSSPLLLTHDQPTTFIFVLLIYFVYSYVSSLVYFPFIFVTQLIF